MVVIGQSGCIRAKMVVHRAKWLCSGKICCIKAKVSVILQSGCFRAKVVVFRKKWL